MDKVKERNTNVRSNQSQEMRNKQLKRGRDSWREGQRKLGSSAPWMAVKTKVTMKEKFHLKNNREQSNGSMSNETEHKPQRTSLHSMMSFISTQKKLKPTKPKETPQEKSRRIRKKLHTLFWTARMICGVAIHMRKDSMRLTEQTDMAELYMLSGNADEEEKKEEKITGHQGLKFDKSLFSRAKGCALPLQARIIATKLPRLRTKEDLQCLYRVMNSMKSFKEKLNLEMKKNVCKMAGFLSCERGRVIFRQGHEGTDFYFVYSGSVFVQVARKKSSGDSVTSVENIIEKGNSFGELALMSDDGIRTATIICREHTELFQIDKESFLEAFSELFKHELLIKLDIAKTIPLFKGWDEESLRSLCFKSNLLTYPYGKVIDDDWSKTNQIFYVVKGKVLLMRAIDVQKSPSATDSFIIDSFGRALPCHNIPQTNRHGSKSARVLSTTSTGTLTRPDSETKFMAIDMLYPTQISDLRTLSKKIKYPMDPIIMVSQGSEVLRFQNQDIQQFAPRQTLETYVREHYRPIELPSLPTLHKIYNEEICWKNYKEQIRRLQEDARSGQAVAMRPATAKGSTGWGRWPGLMLDDFKDRACNLHPDGWSCCCAPKNQMHKGGNSNYLSNVADLKMKSLPT